MNLTSIYLHCVDVNLCCMLGTVLKGLMISSKGHVREELWKLSDLHMGTIEPSQSEPIQAIRSNLTIVGGWVIALIVCPRQFGFFVRRVANSSNDWKLLSSDHLTWLWRLKMKAAGLLKVIFWLFHLPRSESCQSLSTLQQKPIQHVENKSVQKNSNSVLIAMLSGLFNVWRFFHIEVLQVYSKYRHQIRLTSLTTRRFLSFEVGKEFSCSPLLLRGPFFTYSFYHLLKRQT